MGPTFVPSQPADAPAPAAGPRRLGHLLATPTPGPGRLVRPSDVGGRAAWDVLVRDGALRVLRGDAAVPAATLVTPALRASLLVRDLPTGGVVAGRSAAWVHTGRHVSAESADLLDVTYPAGGHRPELWGAGLVWQASLLHGDTEQVGPVRVTTPLRTVVDVALHVAPQDAVRLVHLLAEARAVDLDDAGRLLERRARVVGRPRARRVLAEARAVSACAPGRAALG